MFGLTLRRKTLSSLPREEMGSHVIAKKNIRYIIQRKAQRRKNIALFIEAPGRLRFIAPLKTKTTTIETILIQKHDWIAGKLLKFGDAAPPQFPEHFRDGEKIFYLGKGYILATENDKSKAEGCFLFDQELRINCPGPKSPTEADLRLTVLLWYKKKAKQLLKERTDFWAERLDLQYKSLKITSPNRQWGSCSFRNDIRLNWRVITASPDAIDYLLVHELCHTVHKNHSKKFWDLVACAIPDHKERRKLLRSIDPGFSI